MLCCLLGGALLTALVRATRSRRPRRATPATVVVGGVAAGMFAVEGLISVLVPLGAIDASGPLPARAALLVVPALVAVAAATNGAGSALRDRRGATMLAFSAAVGALLIEEVDLHLAHLHTAQGPAGWSVHLAIAVFVAAGVSLRLAGPQAPVPACPCEPGRDGTPTHVTVPTIDLPPSG